MVYRIAPILIAGMTVLAVGQTGVNGADQELPAGVTTASASPGQFNGLWRYNADESIDITTGRPEREPRGRAPVRPLPDAREDGVNQPTVRSSSPFAPSPLTVREHRDMVRDLMEIPETLQVVVTETAVTITDDLGRERTYPTDGSRHRYLLGASGFSARVRWEGNRLHRVIEGSFGFSMTEIAYLSPGADRLFVILRVGPLASNRPQLGADRVYDRVGVEPQ